VCEPDSEIISLGPALADELGLDFDDSYRLVPTLMSEGVVFGDDALIALAQIVQALTAMSGRAKSQLWMLEAIRTRTVWPEVRNLAG
jgi:hypothetical protein